MFGCIPTFTPPHSFHESLISRPGAFPAGLLNNRRQWFTFRRRLSICPAVVVRQRVYRQRPVRRKIALLDLPCSLSEGRQKATPEMIDQKYLAE